MKRAVTLGLALFVGASAWPAVAVEVAYESACVSVRALDNWDIKNERTMFVEATRDRRFKVTFTTSCLKRWPQTVRVESRGECLMPGDTFVFGRSSGGTPESEERCVVSQVQSVDPSWAETPPPEPPSRHCESVWTPDGPVEVCDLY